MSNIHIDRRDLDTCNENKDMIVLIFFLDSLHLKYMGKKILSNLELCSIEKSSELNEVTQAEAEEWLKKKLLTSSYDKSWYNYCLSSIYRPYDK